MEFAICGLSAMIVERRVPWRPTSPAEEWTRLPIAKFRFDGFLIAGVIVSHAATAYGAIGAWF
jgi:hypothetical protein